MTELGPEAKARRRHRTHLLRMWRIVLDHCSAEDMLFVVDHILPNPSDGSIQLARKCQRLQVFLADRKIDHEVPA